MKKFSVLVVALLAVGCIRGETTRSWTDPDTGESITETVKTRKFDEKQAAFAVKAGRYALEYYGEGQKQKAEAKGAKFQFLRDWSEAQQDRKERLGDKWYNRFKERGGEDSAPGLDAAIGGVRSLLKGD